MFTGLIEEVGIIRKFEATEAGAFLTVECKKILDDVKIGASIAINGACHTVTSFSSDSFSAETSRETLDVTNFKMLKKGDKVNLERAMQLSSRIDGHLVSGHIDGTAEFLFKRNDGFSSKMFFKLNDELEKYVIYKGSIAVNGVSLTVASLEKNIFSVEVIPSTLKETTLNNLNTADIVNIETDFFAKYAAKYVENFSQLGNNTTKITKEFLEENGFF